jgi:hypothetical protein
MFDFLVEAGANIDAEQHLQVIGLWTYSSALSESPILNIYKFNQR